MDSRLAQLLAALKETRASLVEVRAEEKGSDVTRPGVTRIEGSLESVLMTWPFQWSAYRNPTVIITIRTLTEHLRAFQGDGKASTLLWDAEYVIAWYQRLSTGDIPLVGILREEAHPGSPLHGPHAIRVFQRFLARVHWTSTAGVDQAAHAVTLFESLFSKQVWDEFDRVSAGHKKNPRPSLEVAKTVELVKLAADLRDTGTRSFGNIKVIFDEIKTDNEKLVQTNTACVPPAVLDWAHAQVVKIGAASTMLELTAMLRACPYTILCAKAYADKSKTTRKLLKGVRNALFIRFDEITA